MGDCVRIFQEVAVATQPLPELPEGFEDLSKEEQVEYVQALWDRIVESEKHVPVPDWHREILEERVESRDGESDSDWEDVKARLEERCDD
jgi:putative addiction module component (TIGR02574 family)